MANIRDVAAFAEVSTATVSRALNAPHTLSPDTLSRVMHAVQSLDYSAKPKSRKRTNLFGVIFPNISNPFFAQLLEVLEQEAYLHGRSILFFNSKGNERQEQIALHECEAHGVDGVFLVPVGDLPDSYQDKLNDFNYQTVILTRSAKKLPSVSTDHRYGGRESAALLLAQGHTRIGYLGIIEPFDDKYAGFADYLAEQGQQLQAENCFDIRSSRTLESYLESAVFVRRITAFGCGSDVLAQQVLEIHQKWNASLPLSVIGFDNTLISRLLKFSTVSQPMRDIAHIGFELMIEALKNPKNGHYQAQLLLPKLIIR